MDTELATSSHVRESQCSGGWVSLQCLRPGPQNRHVPAAVLSTMKEAEASRLFATMARRMRPGKLISHAHTAHLCALRNASTPAHMVIRRYVRVTKCVVLFVCGGAGGVPAEM